MVGAYIGVYTLGLTGNFWFSLLVVPLVTGCLGLAIERFLIRPLYRRSIDDPLLLTFGLSYLLVDCIRAVFGIAGLPDLDTSGLARCHQHWCRLLSEVPACF